jgi:hypothetical protein
VKAGSSVHKPTAPARLSTQRRRKVIRAAFELLEKQIQTEDIRTSLTDIIRLIKFESDVSQQRANRNITVCWVDSEQPDTASQPSRGTREEECE